ncbi:helix-turn-helix domain-containing protein [Burkholderia glumae]|uniref:helix-turn-helix domain-containing protein n=1 Tax=Burkholderia glumae TaxID=337 RepID=UPI0020CBBDC6|nr:helix-turn-helix transcriptional regulator [Burkholderia glumae]MCQ0031500.1 helix-turn-helix domain-containing protein [Burkholderia glumae]MCQ0035152.1 helix-turn-helix domain-containing protein [Burkholderia glumae]
MNHEQRPCVVLRGFAIKRVERVQGAGWTIDPPSGPRWVAFEGTPAGQLVEALTALDVTAPFAESVTLPDEARACLEALLSHHDAIVDALCAKRNAASRNSDDVSLDYWNKKISAARQMKRQAERALVATQGVDAAAAVAGDAGEADALKIDVAIQAALAGNHDLFVHEDGCAALPSDHPFQAGDKPLCRFAWFEDAGDPSVGIPARSYFALTDDQAGTALADLVAAAPATADERADWNTTRHSLAVVDSITELGSPLSWLRAPQSATTDEQAALDEAFKEHSLPTRMNGGYRSEYDFKAGWKAARALHAAAPQAAMTPEEWEDLTEGVENPLTSYGMLVRALRIVAGTTLMDMATAMRVSPAFLSSLEFGRRPVTYDNAVFASGFFSDKGIVDTLPALAHAAKESQVAEGGKGGE